MFQKPPKILSVDEIIDWNTRRYFSEKKEVLKEVTQIPAVVSNNNIDNFIENESISREVTFDSSNLASLKSSRSSEILWII